MIWLFIVLVSVVVLLPCALVLRRGLGARDRHEAALALHRAQLAELERDRGMGLIADSEYATARLEVQRRLLAEGARTPDPARTGARAPVIAGLALIPLAALGLYLARGRPNLPAEPLAMRIRQMDVSGQDDARLLALLKTRLAGLPQDSPQAQEGYVLLGQAEAARGDWGAAAQAWHHALQAGFDPTLAAQTAEAQVDAEGSVSPDSADLFRRALNAAPKNAPWRLLAEQRIAESEHAH
ncbi:c-type cytochrome biogenesis protein CcmI [Lichenicoccus sp.]|uniref:c-type cytochrome biogenesis protein CcmI n=1 Tax=Lichenicoccus sp. TaxID=2781899 RepID=UPI003D09DDC8